ncbi:MAG TPA: hypothetical protein VKU85_01915, partial [bacterium]|nr:hypothetical protein [bacterium]
LNREMPDEELRADPHHRDMGNPLLDRVPRTLAEYEAAGYDWIVTNWEAQDNYYEEEGAAERFPSFRRFYDALHEREPVRTFDPDEWGGKGPTIWVYDLRD